MCPGKLNIALLYEKEIRNKIGGGTSIRPKKYSKKTALRYAQNAQILEGGIMLDKSNWLQGNDSKRSEELVEW